MDKLHREFLKSADAAIEAKAVDILAQKAVAAGVPDTVQLRRFLAERLQGVHNSDIFVGPGGEDIDSPIEIEVGEGELAALDGAVAALTSRDFLRELTTEMSELHLQTCLDTWPEERARQAEESRGFEERLDVVWGEAISHLALMTTISREFGEMSLVRLRGSETAQGKQHLLEALSRLHARACRMSLEIQTLLRSGFADAALSRWRSMHETTIVALTLKAKGDAIAERYLLHDAIDSLKIATLDRAYAQRLGLSTEADSASVADLEARVEKLRARFGVEFIEPYGWAAEPGQRLRDFASLERAVEMDHWRPYFKLASHGVHATAKGIMFNVGLHPSENVLLTGRSNFGLALAGQNAAISLLQVTCTLPLIDPTLDSIVVAKVLSGLTDRTVASFVSAHERLLQRIAVRGENPRDGSSSND